jgi:hypothetical protein
MKKFLILLLPAFFVCCKKDSPQPAPVPPAPVEKPLKPLKRTARSVADSLPAVEGQTMPNALLYEVINACLSCEKVKAYKARYIQDREMVEIYNKNFGWLMSQNDSIFTQIDQRDMRRMYWRINFRFDETRLPGYAVVNTDSLHDKYGYEDYRNHIMEEYDGKIIDIYLPAFNKARTYAIMEVGFINFLPNGSYNEAYSYILKKGSNGWKVVRVTKDSEHYYKK